MPDQRADIDWTGDVPLSRRFDDPYFSLEDGLAEARHVFLNGNALPDRLTPGFHVAELGFGTGLNLLALADLADRSGAGPVRFTSFEAHPMTAGDMARALRPFAELADLAQALVTEWSRGDLRVTLGPVEARIIPGDARDTLPAWTDRADAWFLDGFAPARNPALWTPECLAEVARHTRPGGTAATYTAAGHVRRALAAAGFSVDRTPGYGRKRHMTVARLP